MATTDPTKVALVLTGSFGARLPVMTDFSTTPTVITIFVAKLFTILAMILRAVTKLCTHVAVVFRLAIDHIAYVTMIPMTMAQQQTSSTMMSIIMASHIAPFTMGTGTVTNNTEANLIA